MTTNHGPFETRDQVSAVPAFRTAHAAAAATTQRGVLTEHAHKILCIALSDAGVELGLHDHAIVQWLAQLDLSQVIVIAAWVTRASLDHRPIPARLREIADIDIGFNAPGIADEINALADRVEAVMSGSDTEAQRAEGYEPSEQAVEAIRRQYVTGEIYEPEAAEQLIKAGVSPVNVSVIINQWQRET